MHLGHCAGRGVCRWVCWGQWYANTYVDSGVGGTVARRSRAKKGRRGGWEDWGVEVGGSAQQCLGYVCIMYRVSMDCHINNLHAAKWRLITHTAHASARKASAMSSLTGIRGLWRSSPAAGLAVLMLLLVAVAVALIPYYPPYDNLVRPCFAPFLLMRTRTSA